MRWRPEGWPGYKRTVNNAYNTNAEIYEAGADAMLRAVLPLIEQEIREHTSKVSFEAIVGSPLWQALKEVDDEML